MLNIKADSRKVKKGDTFVALRGYLSDGHSYIDKAIENGAEKLIVEEGEYSIPYEKVDDTRKYLEDYLVCHYDFINNMNIVGITGTNGKTTTAYLLYQALRKLGNKVIYIGTLGLYDVDGKVSDLPNTSPDICDMYDILVKYYELGYTDVILEASSQGLIKNRLLGIKYNYGIFTNLTQDHLDEHKTMENYRDAKRIMFDNLKEDGISILNIDDKNYKYYETKNNIYYGFNTCDYQVVDFKYYNDKTVFKYKNNNKEVEIETKLLGDYNIYNVLSAIIVLKNMNYPDDLIKNVFKTISNPDGRLDVIKYKTNNIIIDYAHTEDAMNKVINTARLFTLGNIYIVFGCTGNRDTLKRPIMMNVATTNSKYTIVTIDDPHSEDPNNIVNDMLKDNKSTNYEVILDRKKAIEKGISLLKENDTLLILGKGHEKYINYDKVKIPHNDKEEVLKVLDSLKVKESI